MIDKQWAISQIKRKWIEYLAVNEEVHRQRSLPDDWYEIIRSAHRAYYQTMYPLKDMFGIRHAELVNILRQAERERDNIISQDQ